MLKIQQPLVDTFLCTPVLNCWLLLRELLQTIQQRNISLLRSLKDSMSRNSREYVANLLNLSSQDKPSFQGSILWNSTAQSLFYCSPPLTWVLKLEIDFIIINLNCPVSVLKKGTILNWGPLRVTAYYSAHSIHENTSYCLISLPSAAD